MAARLMIAHGCIWMTSVMVRLYVDNCGEQHRLNTFPQAGDTDVGAPVCTTLCTCVTAG